MKILTLVRHAKSSWDDRTIADKLRPLNKRGQHDAPMMGQRLAKHGTRPDLIICSPATRALETAQLIAGKLKYPIDAIAVSDELYGTSLQELLSFIQEFDNSLDRVMLCGHNPELSELADRLSAGGVSELPTCGVVELTFDAPSWLRVSETKPAHVMFDSPKAS